MTVLKIPILKCDRIRLEPLSLTHSAGMFALWCEPAVCEYSGPALDSNGHPIELPARSPAESDRLVQYWVERARLGTGFRWAAILLETSGFVGAVGFNALGACAEYAYHFVPRFWGRGLGTESSQLALSWAFSRDAESVELYIERANARSIRLAERLGFESPTPRTTGQARYVLARKELDA